MENISIEEKIEVLAAGNDDAYSVCLLLVMYNKEYTIEKLYNLGIYGEDLATLAFKCCHIDNIDHLSQTVIFLSYPGLTREEIMNNLHSPNPIHFTPRLIQKGEFWEDLFWDFIWDFRDKVKNNNKSR